MRGIFSIYKPKGPTSYDIIRRFKKIADEVHIGHAGTLDPLASGVLVVGVGREATKRLFQVVAKEKEYVATIKLGANSTTDDEEGEKIKIEVARKPEVGDIENAVRKFIGRIKQIPPRYSAVKISGKPAYKYARAGQEITSLKEREVEIKKIEILNYSWPFLKIKIITGPGTYVRSLARDLGEELKTGGYISELERIRVGEYTKEKSLRLEDFR